MVWSDGSPADFSVWLEGSDPPPLSWACIAVFASAIFQVKVGEREEKIWFRERCKIKKLKKKLTNVSFMYVCVAENGEMLVFFLVFSPNNSLIDNSLSE